MAEYIDRDKVLKYRETVTTDDYSGNETLDVVAVEEILEVEPADVVEKEKYEMLNEWTATLRHQLEETFNRIDELDKLNSNMREKIDKAIEEMEEESNNFTYSTNKTLGASYGFRKAIDILTKNIGE